MRDSMLGAGMLLVCALTGAAMPASAAPPADENFQSYAGDTGTVTTPRTLGGFDYVLDGGGTTYIVDSASFGLTATSSNTMVMNADAASNVRNMEIRASSLADNFKLDSLTLESFGGSSSVEFTVTGYDGGSGTTALVTEAIDITASFTGSTISYVKNASVDGGILTFGSEWQNIDTILFTATDGTGLYFALDDILISPAVPAPVLSNLAGDSVAWAGVGSSVTLDAGGNATASDAELDALNGGTGDWAGGSLTVRRSAGAVSTDVFGFNTSGALFVVSGSDLQAGGLTFASYTHTGGTLTISFTSSSTPATTALVQDVIRRITYRSDTPSGDATVRFSLSDGTTPTTADTTVTSDTIYVTSTGDTAIIDVTNGVSFSEAVAIAAADATGSQTLIFTNSFTAGMTLAGNLSIAESLTLNGDSANGLSINGSTITLLGGGTTLAFTNASGTVTIASTLVGSGALSKAGSNGTLVLTGAGNEANMSGGITVTGGTLQIGNDDYLSSGTLTLNGGTLANNGAAYSLNNAVSLGAGGGTFNVTGTGATTIELTGVASGTGTLQKSGAGTLILAATNNGSGWGATVSAGTLQVSDQTNLGTGTVTLAGGTLALNDTGTHPNAVVVASASTIALGNGSVGTFGGPFSGGGALAVTGAPGGDEEIFLLSNAANSSGWSGTLALSHASAQFPGDAQLTSGAITLDTGAVLRSSGATVVDNAVAVNGAALLQVTSGTLEFAGVVSGSGALTTAGGAGASVRLSGTNTHTGSVSATSATLSVSGGAAIGNASAVTLANGSTLSLQSDETIGSLAASTGNALALGANRLTLGGDGTSTTYSGSISGTGGLTKTGGGTLTLSGTNTSSGATQITSGGVTVSGGSAIGNSSAVTVDSGATLTLSSNETVGSLAGAGTVALGIFTLSSGSTNASTTFSGTINGPGNVTKTGTGTLTLSGSNGYTGTTTVSGNGGTLSIAGAGNISSDTLTLGSGGVLEVTGSNVTLSNDLIINTGGGRVRVANALTLSGIVNGVSGAALTKDGAGVLTLSDTNPVPGNTVVAAGTLLLTGALTATNSVSVLNGATLGGTGTISTANSVVIASGGFLAPGAGGPGILAVNGDLAMFGTLRVDVDGTTAGTGHDQVTVSGDVTLDASGAVLIPTHGYAAGVADSYVVIDNGGGNAIGDTFVGVAEGGTLTALGNGTVLTASYIGGDGNDFVLTAPSNSNPSVTDLDGDSAAYVAGSTVAVDVGGNAVVSDAQNDSANWDGGNVTVQRVTAGSADPAANDVFGFGAGATFTVSGNDLVSGATVFASFTDTGGVLSIGFTGATATTALVQDVVRHITYRNDTPYGDAVLRVSINDGASGSTDADVTLTSGAIYADQANDDADGDASDGYSLREALARGAAQATADTIFVVLPDDTTVTFVSGVTSGAGDTLDVDGADGLNIVGTTLTLGGALGIGNGSGDRATVYATLSGSATLTKSGAGTLVLVSTDNEANHSGATALAGGVLEVGNDDALGSGPLQFDGGTLVGGAFALDVDNAMSFGSGGGTLHADNAWSASGPFSGSGTLTKTGSLLLALTGTSAHSGTTAIDDGTLSIAGDANIGSGTIELDGGTLAVTGDGAIVDNAVTLVGAGGVEIGGATSVALSGPIGGSVMLTKTGAGTLSLTNAGNGASGWGLTLSGGRVDVDAAGKIGSGTITLAGGTLGIAVPSMLTFGQPVQITAPSTIAPASGGIGSVLFTGAMTGSGALNIDASGVIVALSQASGLTGDLTVTATGFGGLAATGSGTFGTGQITLHAGAYLGATGDTRTLSNAIVLAGDASLATGTGTTASETITFSGPIGETGGARALNLSGLMSGTDVVALALSGTSTYTGATTVSGGLVRIDGALAGTSALTVNTGATLGGNGSVFAVGSGNTLTVNGGGALAPGSSPGNLIVNGNLAMTAGSALNVEIDGATPVTGYDRLDVSGSIDFGGATLNVVHGYANATGDQYAVVMRSSAGANTGTFAGLAEGTTFAAGGNGTPLQIGYAGGDGNDVVLTAAAQAITGVSSTTADGTYGTGATIDVTVTFSSPVTVTGLPTLTLETGATDRTATYSGGSGTNTLTFAYTVAGGDTSPDLDYVGTAALALNGGTIQAFGSPVPLTLPAPGSAGSLGANKAIVIDATGPGVTSVQVPADGRYGVGALLNVLVTFDAPIDVTSSNPRIPITLDTGGTIYATYADGHGTTTLTFRATVAAGQNDFTGIAIGSAIDLNGGALEDSAGNAAVLALNGVPSTANVIVDTTAPTVVSLVRADPSPTGAASVTYTLTFDEGVSGVDAADFTVTWTGSASGTVGSVTTSDGVTYMVTVGALTGDGTAQLRLNSGGTGIADGGGNALVGGFAGETYTIDRTAPAVDTVAVPPDDTYVTGETLDFVVAFGEAVTVTGTPRIAIVVDTGGPASATYVAGSGTAMLTFRMIVAAGQVDANGIALAAAIDPNGGTLRDAVGNDAVPVLNGVGSTSGVLIDGTAPGITSVTVPADGRYAAGDVLAFTVHTSEAITVTGTPRLALTVGAATAYANYVSGSGSTALVFQYTVAAGENDADGIAVTALESNGGTLNDGGGNALAPTLAGVGATAGVIVDTTAPAAASLVRADPNPSAATQVGYTLTFSEDVTGVDTADFTPAFTGGAAGSVSAVVAVDARTYTVTVGSLTGSGTLQLVLNGSGTGIADPAGNPLGAGLAGETYTLDRTPAAATSVGVPANGTYGPGNALNFTVTFNVAVTVGTPPPTLTLNIGGRIVQAAYVSGSGTPTLTFRYVVQPTDVDLDGIAVTGFVPGGLADGNGTAVAATLPAIPPTGGIMVAGAIAEPVLVPAGDWIAWIVIVFGVMAFALRRQRAMR